MHRLQNYLSYRRFGTGGSYTLVEKILGTCCEEARYKSIFSAACHGGVWGGGKAPDILKLSTRR